MIRGQISRVIRRQIEDNFREREVRIEQKKKIDRKEEEEGLEIKYKNSIRIRVFRRKDKRLEEREKKRKKKER